MHRRINPIFYSFLALTLVVPQLMAQVTGNDPKDFDIENIGTRDINKGTTNFRSMEGEARLGRQTAEELERTVTLVTVPEINSYVDRIAQNIAKNSDSKFPISIRVIQSDFLNATALPGGFIYVNSATIKALENEAEFAFVIAHLVGHVAARHATEQSSKATVLMTGAMLDSSIREKPQSTPSMQQFEFSRGAVKEADLLGLQYLYKAGYDPKAAVGFFKKLEAIEAAGPKQSSLFHAYPPTAERIKQMESLITKLPSREKNIINIPEFDAVKALVNRDIDIPGK